MALGFRSQGCAARKRPDSIRKLKVRVQRLPICCALALASSTSPPIQERSFAKVLGSTFFRALKQLPIRKDPVGGGFIKDDGVVMKSIKDPKIWLVDTCTVQLQCARVPALRSSFANCRPRRLVFVAVHHNLTGHMF